MVDHKDSDNNTPVISDGDSSPDETILGGYDRVAENIGKGGMLIFDSNVAVGRNDDESRRGSNSNIEEAMSAGDGCSILSIPPEKMKVKFDIITTKHINGSKGKKYINYVIMVLEVPKLDSDRAIIERRYSQFYKLHQELSKQCPLAVLELPFPKKRYFSANFDESVIEQRTRQFEKYLRYVYHQSGVAETKAFRKFFYRPHLKEATQRLKCEEYKKSYDEYRLALQLMKKLGSNRDELVACMCGVVETCRNMRNYVEAEEIGSECLELLHYDVSNSYLLPLIHAIIDARKRLLMNTDGIKQKLKDCEEITAFDLEAIQTLRELSVKRF